MDKHSLDSRNYTNGAPHGYTTVISQRNRHGVEVGGIGAGDRIVYQVGPRATPDVARVVNVYRGHDGRISTFGTNAGTIHANYVMAKLPNYVSADMTQSPSEVAFITAARAAGRKIYCLMKTQAEEGGTDWQECKGNFAFNFSSLLYKVVDDNGHTITEQGVAPNEYWGANVTVEKQK